MCECASVNVANETRTSGIAASALGTVLLLLTSLPTPAGAEWVRPTDGPIATDRPGNANAATTMTRGHLNAELGVLSAHPGHAHVVDTYWYLAAIPELLQLAAERIETPAAERS